jgi:hypothetical protein
VSYKGWDDHKVVLKWQQFVVTWGSQGVEGRIVEGGRGKVGGVGYKVTSPPPGGVRVGGPMGGSVPKPLGGPFGGPLGYPLIASMSWSLIFPTTRSRSRISAVPLTPSRTQLREVFS